MFQKLHKFEHENAFSRAAQGGRIDIIRYLAERFPTKSYPPGINIRNNTGRTPISIAMWGEKTEAIKVLLECGADPNIADDDGRTPWSYGHLNPRAQEALIKYSNVEVVRSHRPEYQLRLESSMAVNDIMFQQAMTALTGCTSSSMDSQ